LDYHKYYITGKCDEGKFYWYELAGGMYGYLGCDITDSVMYYSELLNHDRLQH